MGAKILQYDGQAMTFSIMTILNSSGKKVNTIESIIKTIKKHTNIEAIGIRLKSGSDFPYYTTMGFSNKFVETERSLYKYDENNQIIKEKNGTPILDCMCGNVLCGRTNPAMPFFTTYGSFYSNCTTELLNTKTEKERLGPTRNICNKEGYESVALIPLHDEKEIIGLLQLNDKRCGMFSKKDIYYFEQLGSSIGIALTKKVNQELLHLMNVQLEQKINTRTKELSRALQAKDILLQEVHHRITNNLNTVSSLLYLQSIQSRNASVKNALIDASSRVQAMGAIHRKLYKARDFSNISVKNYLGELIEEISKNYEVDKDKITINFNCGTIHMNIDTAIPFGLIVNELIINSIKHAFTGKKKGTINISLSFKNSYYHLNLKDNGTGFPKYFNSNKNGRLGFMIINNLVKQLDGTIEFNNKNGTSFDIRFQKEMKEEKRWKKRMY